VRKPPGRPAPAAPRGAAIQPTRVSVVRTARPTPMVHAAASTPDTGRGLRVSSSSPVTPDRAILLSTLRGAARSRSMKAVTVVDVLKTFGPHRALRSPACRAPSLPGAPGPGRDDRPAVAAGAAPAGGDDGQRDFMISRMMRAVSLGVLPTRTPTFSNASFLACAVPDDPDTIAPACPIVLPSGAVNPATYATTGLDTDDSMNAAARSSASPPISPIITIASVAGSASNAASASICVVPITGSPPIPTAVENPTSASSYIS